MFSLPSFPFLHISTVFYRPLFKQTLAWLLLFSFTFIQGRALLCRCAPSGLPVPFTVHVNVRGMPGMCPQPTSCVESKRQSIIVCTYVHYWHMLLCVPQWLYCASPYSKPSKDTTLNSEKEPVPLSLVLCSLCLQWNNWPMETYNIWTGNNSKGSIVSMNYNQLVLNFRQITNKEANLKEFPWKTHE